MHETAPLHIETAPGTSDVMVVRVQGEIDISSIADLKSTMNALIGEGHRKLLLNLDAVDYIDSLGFGIIIGALKRMRELNGDISIVCTRMHVRKLIAVTALDKLFGVYDSEEEFFKSSRAGA